MSIVATIAEFHPYHNGHRYLLKQAVSLTHADFSIALMSGNFLQRGSIALWYKYARASMAIADGFDLCLELPFVYATGSARDFAMGAISILNHLQCIDYLAFGVEDNCPEDFFRLADIFASEPEEYKDILRKELANGNPYPKASQLAISKICGDSAARLLEKPNNTLALSYLTALKKSESSIKPVFIKRISSGYHDIDLKANISSATAIRTSLINGISQNELSSQIPETTIPYLTCPLKDENSNQTLTPVSDYLSDNMLTPFVQAFLLQKKDLTTICDMSPALVDKLHHVNPANDYESLIESVKTKDITRSRIARAFLHAILHYTEYDRTQFLKNGYAYYANILAMKKTSGTIVRKLHKNSQIPIITKKADIASLIMQYPSIDSSLAKTMWEYDSQATSLYNCIYFNHYGVSLPNDYTIKLPVLS